MQENQQTAEREIKSRINLLLDDMNARQKADILSDLAEFWQEAAYQEDLTELAPHYQELAAAQARLIERLERLKKMWAILAICEFIILVYLFIRSF